MRRLRLIVLATTTSALVSPSVAIADKPDRHTQTPSSAAGPLVIGHRGASGYRPEHTLASYRLAAEQGADFIEPDLVITKDGVLVARHENEIGGTTNVASHPEFAGRKTTKVIDGASLTGWFTEDFTLAELKTLRAKERIPALRPDNTRFDGQFEVPTFQEVLDLRRRLSKELGRPIGVYPETKHPSYFRSIGLPLEPALVRTLNRNGLNRRRAPVFVQSFEVGNLKALDRKLRVPLVQLLDEESVKPADDDRTYGELATPAGLRSIARYADGVGPWKNYIIPRKADGSTGTPTRFVADAHAAGLVVHPYTFRRENSFVPLELRSSAVPAEIGDLDAELRQFISLGVDGFFTDNPDVGVGATLPKPTLAGRALLPAAAMAAAPFPGLINTEPAPAAGATQPVGGFSALLDAPGKDTFWAMPDNGFGNKANSRSFLLRAYRIQAGFETADGGSGDVKILDWITLRDPDRKIPFAIVNATTTDRLLTGGDFDIESMRIDRHGELWFGDEFGPFLLHTDATGKVLEAPIPLPGVKSPDYPADYPAPVAGAANLPSSNGFEGMAISPDGRTLYPVLEGPVAGDAQRVRRLHEFDIASRAYSGRTWNYEVADPTFLVADFTSLGSGRFVALERDNFQGVQARHKQAFALRLPASSGSTTPLAKRTVADLLALRDPARISLPARAGDIGLGDPFSMPYVTIESVLPVGGDRLAIVNDTNFGSTGRNAGLPDYSDFVIVHAPGVRR